MQQIRHTFLNIGYRFARLYAGLGLSVLLVSMCVSMSRSQSSGSHGGQGQGLGQDQGPNQVHINSSDSIRQSPSDLLYGNIDSVMAERRALALNIQRQKQMVADSDKLLKLTRALNDEVAAANTGSLTAEQLRKIAEIEKLARNVKQRMTDGVGPPPALQTQPGVVFSSLPNH